MNCVRYLLAMGLLAFAVQARADGWVQDKIDTIVDQVQAVWNTVTNEVKETAQDLQRQLNSLNQQGQTARETVQDVLDFLQHRRRPFQDFVNGNPPANTGRCGPNTPCAQFRVDLQDFVLDMADLKPLFPHIEKHGLGDGTIMVDVIEHLPPIALFPVYEIFQRIPDWQDIPQNLADLHAEVGDDDVWAIEIPEGTAKTTVGVATAPEKPGKRPPPPPPSTTPPGLGQANFGSPNKGTEKFCSQGKQAGKDAVRANRWKIFTLHARNLIGGFSEFVAEGSVIGAAGETASFHWPWRATLKAVANVLDSISSQIELFHAQLDICKQIETDVAGCTPLLEYRTQAGSRKAYWVVKGVLNANPDLPTAQAANALLDQAGDNYKASSWKDAYGNICDAYAAL